MNANLAKIYGVPAPAAGTWQKVTFAGEHDRASGVLTQGTILAAGSHGDKPSARAAGRWCASSSCADVPSPPPAWSANLPPAMAGRDRAADVLAPHDAGVVRRVPQLMDPIGWGLSGFDVGRRDPHEGHNGQPLSVRGKSTA